MQDIVPILIDILEQYGYIIVLLGTIIGGELVILAAVFLASIGMLNIYLVVILGMAGIIISDNFWYFIGAKARGKLNYSSLSSPKSIFPFKKIQHKIDDFKEKFADHYAKFIILSKFVYGTRIITLVTSGYQNVLYKKFVIFNLIGSVLWMTIIVFLGYVMGVSWNYLTEYNESAKYYVLFGILILFVIRYIFNRFIKLDGKRHRGNKR